MIIFANSYNYTPQNVTGGGEAVTISYIYKKIEKHTSLIRCKITYWGRFK